MVHPTDHEYKNMVGNKILPNFPITTHEITNENYMFGPDLAGVRGEMRNKQIRVSRE